MSFECSNVRCLKKYEMRPQSIPSLETLDAVKGMH